MSKQLDILALEPFFGGVRKNMLETMIRCSRHRWTLLKLPPRRIERRLAAAAHWFAEQLSRHWVGHVDAIFASEALNLADLFRVMPALSQKPSVVYFHSNELPEANATDTISATEFANLSTASAASEIWFNSKFHIRAFLAGVSELAKGNPDLAGQDPVRLLTKKMHLMPPAVDLGVTSEVIQLHAGLRDPHAIFVETRDANVNLLNEAIRILQRGGEKIELITVGPVEGLTTEVPRQTVPENDLTGQARGMMQSNLFVSTKIASPFDEHAVRAIQLGCRPVMPRTGFYLELLPREMYGYALYDVDAESLATRIQDALYASNEYPGSIELRERLRRFDPITACRAMDDRIAQLAANSSSSSTGTPAHPQPAPSLGELPRAPGRELTELE